MIVEEAETLDTTLDMPKECSPVADSRGVHGRPWRHPMKNEATATRRGGGNAGEYKPLYEYLRDRFADRFVLTFGQIEDLLGFSLPDPARVEREWWEGPDPVTGRSHQSDAWTLAGRSASVNLSARCVTFEREAAPRART
jgi:hypothetical protein